MPHRTIKLIPGINQNRTPALNEAGIESGNLIRFMPDDQGIALVQKLGGWTRWFSQQVNSIIRALWAWEDTDANQLLAVGSENSLSAIYGISPNGTQQYITPWLNTVDIAVAAATTAGNSLVQITDTGSSIFAYDSVFIQTQISVGGVVLFGLYPIYANTGANSYQVQATNVLGQIIGAPFTSTSTQYQVLGAFTAVSTGGTCTLTFTGPVTFPVSSTISVAGLGVSGLNGTFTVTGSSTTTVQYASAITASTSATQGAIIGGPSVPLINTTTSSPTVTVIFPNHGYSVGNAFAVLTPTMVGGVTFSGNYIVQTVPDVNTFTITSLNAITSTAQGFLNGGNAQYLYYIGQGQTPANAGYGTGGYGVGGYGSGATLSVGRTFTTTAASGTGTIATVSFTGNYYIPIGSTITVSGMTPSGYNATSATVTATLPGSTTTVSYASTATGAQSVAGTITVLSWATYPTLGTFATTAFSGTGASSSPVATVTIAGSYYVPAGYWVTISGVTPTGYNGTYQVLSSSIAGGNTKISYQNATSGAQTVAGTVTIFNKAVDWSMDNWGDILLANPEGGAIYQWYYLLGSPIASVIPQAPTNSMGMFVAMPQRQIVAWGTTFTGIIDPLLVRWCDVNNYGTWIGQVINQAGSYRIPRGSRIVGAMQGPQQCLIWTDLAVWSMQYVGQPYIYAFNEVATGCGLIAKKAAASMNNVVYWMGQSQFFKISPNGIEPIYCPIWDVIFQQLDRSNLGKIRVAANSRFNEVAWYYPTTTSGGEVSNYVKYNVLMDKWDYGTLSRTAWINESVLGPPIGAGFPVGSTSGSQYIYQHETSPDADGTAMLSNFTTGYFALDEGDQKTFIDEFWPDFKYGYFNGPQSANVQLTFYTTDFPEQTPVVYGPYSVTQSTTWFNPRIRARLLAYEVSSMDTGSFWRIGANRYRGQPSGRY